MNLDSKKIVNVFEDKYIIMTVVNYNGIDYALGNKLDRENDDITDEYRIMYTMDNEIVFVNDEELLNELLPKFQKNIDSTLDEIMKGTNR